MKLIFGFVFFVVAVIVTGGLYLLVRKPDGKTADMGRIKSLSARIGDTFKSMIKYLTTLFATKPATEAEIGFTVQS